jgi:hypothetical protein
MGPNGLLGKPLMEPNGRPEKPWMERDGLPAKWQTAQIGRLAKWLKAQNGLQTASSTPQTGDSNLSKEKSRFFDHLCHHQRPPETPGVFVFIGALTLHGRFNADVTGHPYAANPFHPFFQAFASITGIVFFNHPGDSRLWPARNSNEL